MKKNYERIMEEVFKHEGGYVDHPKDPGGATNMGITFNTLKSWLGRQITKADVKSLTKATARQIYKVRYWNVIKGDQIPSGVDAFMMDYAVNSGPVRAVMHLQSIVGTAQDGKMGPITLGALEKLDPLTVLEKLYNKRMSFLRSLSTWGTFGRGWTNRNNSVLALGKELIEKPQTEPQPSPSTKPKNLLELIVEFFKKLFQR